MQKTLVPTIISAEQRGIMREYISEAALKVVERLQQSGFSAYIVGGGVRDLLAGHIPKDFDVATDARPEQIKPLFRRCFLIGKRFRLAHVYVDNEVIEVATFRADPTKSLNTESRKTGTLILRDNVFGTIEEDAWRRDFTINALYYDPHQGKVIDYCHGLKDLAERQICMLGDPHQRYQEDPVRLLRAIRLAAKLDFTIEALTAAPIQSLSYLLHQVPSARLFDEILKMFLKGEGEKTLNLCLQYDLFKYLFPATMMCMQPGEKYPETTAFIIRALQNSDQRLAEGKTVTPTFFLAAMLWYPLRYNFALERPQHRHEAPAFESAIWQTLKHQQHITAIPKQLSGGMLDIWRLQWRMEKRKRIAVFKIITHPRFRAAYDFLLLRAEIDPKLQSLAQWWTTFYEADTNVQTRMARQL